MNRLERLRKFLLEDQIDSIIIKNTSSIRYFSGFSGDDSLLYVNKDKMMIITDSRYTLQAEMETVDCEVVEHVGGVWSAVKKLDLHKQKIAFEKADFTVEDYQSLTGVCFECKLLGINLVPLRIIKDESELDKIKKAVQISDEAFAKMLPQLYSGMTEIEAAAVLEFEMRKLGSEAVSFPTIVASGKRSALPHGLATTKVIEMGDFVTFDFGAIFAGYHSDITRTIVMGRASQRQEELYDLVLQAQLLGVSSAKPGITGKELDDIVRDFIVQAGYGKYFGHGLGHGVGLDIHELPVASKRGDIVFAENMVVTVEPGIYLPDEGGVRIEDIIVIKASGCEVLTASDKKLLELC